VKQTDLRALEAALRRLRDEILATGPSKIEPNRTDPTSTGVADEDAQALSEMLQTLASQRNRAQADLLARVDRALRKVADNPDEFGTCEECDEDIPPKRLLLMPHATLCATCQSTRDPKRCQARKKITDYS